MAFNPLKHPGARGKPILDLEKQDAGATVNVETAAELPDSPPSTPRGTLARWNDAVESLAGLEARGISRVLPEEKHTGNAAGYIQMFALWYGMNLNVIFVVSGLLGPTIFHLGFVDCVCIVIFANVPGILAGKACMPAQYHHADWGGIIACIFAGQMLSAVNGHGLSIGVGCAIAAICIGVLCVFGIAILHIYERYAWYPQAFALLILIGSSGRHWDTSTVSSGDAATVTANRCSFFALIFASVAGLAAISSDFYVYYPTNTSKRLTFAMSWSGIAVASIITELIGVGIATGVAARASWSEAYNISSGALLMACYEGLGDFGGFCGVLIAFGAIQSVAPSTYVAALSIQTLGRYVKAIPRWVLCIFIVSIELACSVAGRNSLYVIFGNVLPIMAYWVCPWLTIVIEEHVLFHKIRRIPFDWTIWEDRHKLPFGGAAMLAWLVGWAGAIVGMAQVWYAGPVAIQIGGYGGDIGGWLSIAFAGLVYPPLRWLELSIIGR